MENGAAHTLATNGDLTASSSSASLATVTAPFVKKPATRTSSLADRAVEKEDGFVGSINSWGGDGSQPNFRSSDSTTPHPYTALSQPGGLYSTAPPSGVQEANSSSRPTISPRGSSLLPLASEISESRRSSASREPRVPSRQLLQTALDLAQRAVEMDKNNDVTGALNAYREAVTKLRVVMERVGVEPHQDSKRSGKTEEEGRTLRGIHDAYLARITLLSAYESPTAEESMTMGIGNLMLTEAESGQDVTSIPNAEAKSDPETPVRQDFQTPDPGPSTPSVRSPTSIPGSGGRRKRKVSSKQSFGLDAEADLSGVDGVDDVEVLMKTPQDLFHGHSTRSPMPLVDASPRSSFGSEERPLPPLPPSSGVGSSRKSSLTGASLPLDRYLVSPTTSQGTISQRRHQRAAGGASMTSINEIHDTPSPSSSFVEQFPRDVSSPSTRLRAKSITKASPFRSESDVPPVPPIHSTYRPTATPLLQLREKTQMSPQPEDQPTEIVLRPFHLLRILLASMDPEGPGAYLTSSIHIDPAVWKPVYGRGNKSAPPPPKLASPEVKARCIEALLGQLDLIKQIGAPLLEGPREERYGAEGQIHISKSGMQQLINIAEELSHVLDGLDDEFDQTHKALVSKGVPVGNWKGKSKSSWGSRLSRSVDKMTKSVDSPDRYVDLLSHLFFKLQVIEDHMRCFTGPCTPAYHALPVKNYKQIESRIIRVSEFIGAVIIPFVLDDFKQFLLRYLKGGLKYLEE